LKAPRPPAEAGPAEKTGELLDLRGQLGDQLRQALTPEAIAAIVGSAVREARGSGPSASKARRFLLDALDLLTSEELAELRRSAGWREVWREALAGAEEAGD